jgi:hypothetical protein
MKNENALVVLEEVAVSLREAAENSEVTSTFDEGRMMGYYEALSTLLSQCAVAGIAQKDIGMDGFVAESILRPMKRAA